MMRLLSAFFLLFSLCATAFGETLLNEAQALKIIFSKSESVAAETKILSESQRADLQNRANLRFPERGYRFFTGKSKDRVDGYAVVMNEIGKHEFITFIVGISPKGEVTDVAVMEYRESRGWEVKERRFLSQFRGKKSSDPIQVNRDITNYTGATLSSHAISRGVKRALVLTEMLYLGK